MSKVIVLGSGLVAKPGTQYLAEHKFQVTVASRTLEKAKELIEQTKKDSKIKDLDLTAVECDVSKHEDVLDKLVSENDYIISLLPYIHHVQVAKIAIHYKKDFFTTSNF
jgi:saccharopine dehydrogenase-like NADP-dependent oxidoreductase